ncbi:hypothetical protein [Streptomyces tubercidicus]|uniref:hypothetical protein n=1 Tax=Streptomyces tubercidicus TaxID=47759 RepID=UPI002E1980A4|nr:hypothetical protein OG690_14925 [Streptomyces tubercidicus]
MGILDHVGSEEQWLDVLLHAEAQDGRQSSDVTEVALGERDLGETSVFKKPFLGFRPHLGKEGNK